MWNLPNCVVWICHSSGKGKNEWFMRKRNDCCDSFNEIAFKIDWLSYIQIGGG